MPNWNLEKQHQRKRQFLINEIRKNFDYTNFKDINQEKIQTELTLWNLTNEEFDKIMEAYEKC